MTHIPAPTLSVEPPRGPYHTHRIRRCNGNKAAWLLCPVNEDGSEILIGSLYKTAMSLDSLMQNATPFMRIDFVFTPAE